MKKTASKIQSLLFSKNVYTKARAKAWAKRGGFKYGRVETGGPDSNYIRIRQRDPQPKNWQKLNGTFRTKTLTKGVRAIIGRPRKKNPGQTDNEVFIINPDYSSSRPYVERETSLSTKGGRSMAKRRKRRTPVRRRARRRRRRNPVAVYRRKRRYTRIAPRRTRMSRRMRRHVARRRRSYRRNPALPNILRAFRMPNLIDVAGVTTGFIVGVKATKFITQPVFMQNIRRFAGFVHIAIGFVLAGMGRQAFIKRMGAGFAAAGMYDLITQNIPQLALSPMEGVDLELGQDIPPDNTLEVVGDNMEVVGADIPEFEGMDIEDMEDYAL